MCSQFIFLCLSPADVVTKLTTAIPLPAGFTAHRLGWEWEMRDGRWELGDGSWEVEHGRWELGSTGGKLHLWFMCAHSPGRWVRMTVGESQWQEKEIAGFLETWALLRAAPPRLTAGGTALQPWQFVHKPRDFGIFVKPLALNAFVFPVVFWIATCEKCNLNGRNKSEGQKTTTLCELL